MKARPTIVAAVLAVGAMAAFALAKVSGPSVSDNALENRFTTHRTDFEKLVSMSSEDKHLTRIAVDFTWLEDNVAWPRKDVGISQDRWNDYRQLFQKVGVSNGIIRHNNPTRVIFPIVSEGLVPAGAAKGLVYSEAPLTPVLKSLDKAPQRELWDGPDHSHLLVYKPVEDHWYIYYERW